MALPFSASLAGLLLPAAVGLAVGGWTGYKLAATQCDARARTAAVEHAAALQSALDAAQRNAEIEQQRALAAAVSRAKRRATAGEVKHAIAANVDRACERRDDHRLRLESLYGAYGYRPSGAAGVPDTVRGPAESGAAP